MPPSGAQFDEPKRRIGRYIRWNRALMRRHDKYALSVAMPFHSMEGKLAISLCKRGLDDRNFRARSCHTPRWSAPRRLRRPPGWLTLARSSVPICARARFNSARPPALLSAAAATASMCLRRNLKALSPVHQQSSCALRNAPLTGVDASRTDRLPCHNCSFSSRLCRREGVGEICVERTGGLREDSGLLEAVMAD